MLGVWGDSYPHSPFRQSVHDRVAQHAACHVFGDMLDHLSGGMLDHLFGGMLNHAVI